MFITFRQRNRQLANTPCVQSALAALTSPFAFDVARSLCPVYLGPHHRNGWFPPCLEATPSDVLEFDRTPRVGYGSDDKSAQRRCRRREVVGRVRRRTRRLRGGAGAGQLHPAARRATSPAPMTGATAPVQSGQRRIGGARGGAGWTAPRNWRVATRLNAILLIPVLVGLVVGGFQVRSSVDTWQEAQDAERTALVVRAASGYAQALFNERDLTCSAAAVQQARQHGRHRRVRGNRRRRAEVRRGREESPPDTAPDPSPAAVPQGGAQARRDTKDRVRRSPGPGEDRRGLRLGPALADGVLQRAPARHRQHHLLRPYRLHDLSWPKPPSR